MVAATYGFVSAFGQNIALIPTLTTGMKWFPNRKGIMKTHNVMYDILELYEYSFCRNNGITKLYIFQQEP